MKPETHDLIPHPKPMDIHLFHHLLLLLICPPTRLPLLGANHTPPASASANPPTRNPFTLSLSPPLSSLNPTTTMKLVILLPDVISIRVITRSVLLAAALLSFPWFPNGFATVPKPDPKWVDNPFLLPMLIADLKREGLFTANCRAVFIGDPGSRVSFLRRNRIDPISIGYAKRVGNGVGGGSVDFVFAAADGVKGEGWFELVDRVVRVGGVVVFRFGSDLKICTLLPANYRVAYIRRFGSTVVALKKVSDGNAGGVRGYGKKKRRFSIVRN